MYKKILLLTLAVSLVSGCKTTKEVQKKEEVVQYEQEIIEEVKVPDRVYFGYDRYELTKKTKDVLRLQAEWLKQEDHIKILVEGHCDERGSKAYNMMLGEKRAKAVKDYLVKKGVSKNRIQIVSHGKDKPEYIGKGESVWSKNRRAVIVVRN